MSYIKLGQIIDQATLGSLYIEDQHGIVHQMSNPPFPLVVSVEVIDWVSQQDQQISGKINALHVEIITVPDQSILIRQLVFNQLQGKYPGLVI